MLKEYSVFFDEVFEVSKSLVDKYYLTDVETSFKSDLSPVTQADQLIELAIKDLCTKHYPDVSFLGEEYGEKNHSDSNGYKWVVDPIDGTKSFICGIPLFGTLISLVKDDVPILGAIDMPILQQRWVSEKDVATYLNGQQCFTSNTYQISDAKLCCTRPDMFEGKNLANFEELLAKVAVTRFGGDCYSYGLLASGLVDLVVEGDLKYHDVCALIPVIEAAGGIVTDWAGNTITPDWNGMVIAASTKESHAQTLAMLN